jgi:hypothetical protein
MEMGLLQKIGARLTADPDQIRDQEVRSFCTQLHDVAQIAEVRPRTRTRLVGIVQSIKVIPRGTTSILEIEIFDGTDSLLGVWYGRREIPGIALGRPVILEGTTMKTPDRSTLYMINPAYHLVGTEAL